MDYVILIIAEYMDDENCIGIQTQLKNSNIKYKLNINKTNNYWHFSFIQSTVLDVGLFLAWFQTRGLWFVLKKQK